MNKKGQALVLFILIIPVLLLLSALVIDTGLVINKKLTINNIIENERDIDKIRSALVLNNIRTKSIKENRNCIIIESERESLFGKIIGINEYKIEVKNCK